MNKKEAEELLPSAPTRSKVNPAALVYLMIGPPKWGKTTFMCSIPDCLLLAFERGHAFQEAHKIGIAKWAGKHEITEDDEGVRYMTMEQVSNILEATDKFSFIIFDTADMAAKMCSDYYCQKFGWDHVSSGGDYGKGYDIGQNTPFRQMVGAILRTGRGVGFITHSQISTKKLSKGDVSKKETTLPGGIHKFIHTQADIMLHAEFGPRGERILRTAGDEDTLAGNRVKGLTLPPRFIVDPKDPWKQWLSFFNDPKAAAKAAADLEKISLKSKPKDENETL